MKHLTILLAFISVSVFGQQIETKKIYSTVLDQERSMWIYSPWQYEEYPDAHNPYDSKAVWLVKPVRVSTQFVVLDGIVWNLLTPDVITQDDANPAYETSNAYLNKSGGKYASLVAGPIDILFMLIAFLLPEGTES